MKRSVNENKQGSDMIRFKNRITIYGEGSYIMENWRTQFSNANGAIFMAEVDDSDTECLRVEQNRATRYAVCSHKRRQMISCEPKLWGDYTVDSNMFTCVKPTDNQFRRMPNWRKTNIPISYPLPKDTHASDLRAFKEEKRVRIYIQLTYRAMILT